MKQALWILPFFVYVSCVNGAVEQSQMGANRFAIPDRFYEEHDFHPAGYLERFSVSDPREELSDSERGELAALFVAAADACETKYNQDCSLRTTAPLYRLLRRNEPAVTAAETEGGKVVFLGEVARLLSTAVGR